MRHAGEAPRQLTGARVAVVVSTYHGSVTERLRQGAVAALSAARVGHEGIEIVRVPGAFEIPMAARQAALTGRFDAIVCLGCLIKGETPHFDFIAAAVAQGLMTAAGETGVPMTFGVLTTHSLDEALARAGDDPSNKGWEAAAAAVEMVAVTRLLREGAGTPPSPGTT